MSDNKALTLEQLREMDGEPVWSNKTKTWYLVYYLKFTGFFMLNDRFGDTHSYQELRPLFCRPPEGEEDA